MKEVKTENKVVNQINKAEEEKIDMSDEIDTQSSQEGRAIAFQKKRRQGWSVL